MKLLMISLALVLMSGCATIKLGPSYDEPLKEQTLSKVKDADGKVLLIAIEGTISDQSSAGFLSAGPSLLDKVMMQLAKAEKDPMVKTVLLKVNSPGGGVTTSDILYHELHAFKKRTGKKIWVQMMDVAASGGYYLSMSADHIQAHPTTVTGSVGVITVLPNVTELGEKVGVKVNTYTTGKFKDVGSPFRESSEQDDAFMQDLINQMADRFYRVVKFNRGLSEAQMTEVKTARVYTGWEAKKAGLVDSLGYLSDAIPAACLLGGGQKCDLVSYRFDRNQNANLYSPNMQQGSLGKNQLKLMQTDLLDPVLSLKPGNYYLYLN